MTGSCEPSVGEAGADCSITLVHILDLPGLTSAKPAPARVDLGALVEFCETRLAQLNDRPGVEETRLAAKSRERFTL
jgi:hypothetical protein